MAAFLTKIISKMWGNSGVEMIGKLSKIQMQPMGPTSLVQIRKTTGLG